jgi:hypothetical protein
VGAHGSLVRIPYASFPANPAEPGFGGASITWVPVIQVQLIVNHAASRRFEALADSGSFSTLFHSSIGTALGLKIETGQRSVLSGVVAGAEGAIYYHKVKLRVAGSIFEINAGFYESLSLAGILGRHGLFEHFTVTFDPANQPPGMEITRLYRA